MEVKFSAGLKAQAVSLFGMLISRQLTERYRAIELFDAGISEVDVPLLRSLIAQALVEEYSIDKERLNGDPSIRDTRSWLLSALGRLSAMDEPTTQTVLRYIDMKFEPAKWVRYWALEGLISGRNSSASAASKAVLAQEDDPLVAMLANAFLASKGDVDAQERITEAIRQGQDRWATFRALRVVLLPFAVDTLCQTVELSEYTDETYDAIVALGKLPSASPRALNAAQALSAAVLKLRGKPWQDGMRTAAITALGNLGVENFGPMLVDELFDDNPAIARQAIRSVERILGLHTAVARIVEVATRRGNEHAVEALGRALRWLDRTAVAEELEGFMSTASTEQQDTARALLSEIGGIVAFEKLRARTAAMKQFVDVLDRAEERVSALFEQSVQEARKGFSFATRMDVAVFVLGMALLAVSAGLALFKTGDFAAWAGVGGTGVLGVVYGLLIANPRQKVREAVDHLMTVKIIFLAYLRRLHQTDQSFTRLLLDNDKIPVDQLSAYSEVVGKIMGDTLTQLSKGEKP